MANRLATAPAVDIVADLAQRRVSAVQALVFFARAAYVTQAKLNCFTSVMFERAMTRAKQLDEHLASTGRVVGPLHGLPST